MRPQETNLSDKNNPLQNLCPPCLFTNILPVQLDKLSLKIVFLGALNSADEEDKI